MTVNGKLFVLEASGDGRLFSINPDGSGKTFLVTGCPVPDGVAVDVQAGHIYWTNMGIPSANDGSIERVDLDGSNRTTILPSGGTYTPKQLHFDAVDRKLYWSDREGMRVMRSDLDGSNVETLVQTGQGDADRRDQTNWCVGVAVDHVGGHLYWTQKGPDNAGLGRILRAGIDLPAGETAVNRGDIEVMFKDLPEPIDLEIDTTTRMLYWTDRGDPPHGNTVNRARLDIDRTGRIRNRVGPLDGRHRHRAGSGQQPDVRHRLRRQRVGGRPRRIRQPTHPCRARQSHRYRLRRAAHRELGEGGQKGDTRMLCRSTTLWARRAWGKCTIFDHFSSISPTLGEPNYSRR